MKIDFPEHPPGPWQRLSLWERLRPGIDFTATVRRINYRWTVDHRGCQCHEYWEYR